VEQTWAPVLRRLQNFSAIGGASSVRSGASAAAALIDIKTPNSAKRDESSYGC
jgi:hypothetical protein